MITIAGVKKQVSEIVAGSAGYWGFGGTWANKFIPELDNQSYPSEVHFKQAVYEAAGRQVPAKVRGAVALVKLTPRQLLHLCSVKSAKAIAASGKIERRGVANCIWTGANRENAVQGTIPLGNRILLVIKTKTLENIQEEKKNVWKILENVPISEVAVARAGNISDCQPMIRFVAGSQNPLNFDDFKY